MSEFKLVLKRPSDTLSHAGKKGMKWGYNDGVRNGKRTAEAILELFDEMGFELENVSKDEIKWMYNNQNYKALSDEDKKKYQDVYKRYKTDAANAMKKANANQAERMKKLPLYSDENSGVSGLVNKLNKQTSNIAKSGAAVNLHKSATSGGLTDNRSNVDKLADATVNKARTKSAIADLHKSTTNGGLTNKSTVADSVRKSTANAHNATVSGGLTTSAPKKKSAVDKAKSSNAAVNLHKSATSGGLDSSDNRTNVKKALDKSGVTKTLAAKKAQTTAKSTHANITSGGLVLPDTDSATLERNAKKFREESAAMAKAAEDWFKRLRG